ncbi:MAG TPA: YciK family oxidoreductase [Burkholderiales bacterium]|nr:YciK family oxidoreductase [Burkholderiales bacterium]
MTEISSYKARPDLLKGRVILVTGATRGIGRVAALTFAAHGATVVLHGRDVSALEQVYDEIEEKGHAEPAAIPLDLERAGTREFDGLADAIESRLGRLDGLLHNAAQFEKLSSLEHQTAEAWSRVLQVNLIAPFALTQACARLLKASADASVVFTSETHGHVPAPYWGSYSASKAGLEALMKIQAAEWDGLANLRANAVIPGPVDSPSRTKTHPGELAESRRTPENLMPTYLFLLGPDSRGVTGKIIEC